MKASRRTSDRKLANSSLQKLASYSSAATALGVGAMALTMPCNAEVVYTSTHIDLPLFSTTDLDLNNDGALDFRIINYETYSVTFKNAYPLILSGGGKNRVVGERTTFWHFLARFDAGVPVGPELFKNGSVPNGLVYRHQHNIASLTDSTQGFWKGNINEKYVALKFLIDGETHYGWMRLSTRSRLNGAILTGYAYETVPNKPILTGQTGSNGISQLPSPSLGQLARGASEISLWRDISK